jgi:ParB family chromosome partitioning protein
MPASPAVPTAAFLKKVDRFSDRGACPSACGQREDYASRLRRSTRASSALSRHAAGRGFKSPYLRNYVVARINPVRFHKTKKGDSTPPCRIGPGADAHGGAARNFSLSSVSNSELAWVAIGAGSAE